MNRHGGALLATIIISTLLLSVVLWYFSWSGMQSQGTTRSRATQRAQEYADSGLEAAEDQLMRPFAGEGFNVDNGSGDMTGGRYEFQISQDSQTPTQVDVYSTGYCNFPKGTDLDPLTQQHVQRAMVHAEYYVNRMDKLMVVVPGKLRVGPGTVANGMVFASDLVFAKGSDEAPSRIGEALYSHSITREDGTADSEPSYVVFSSTPIRIGYPIHFPQLSSNVRNFYQTRATSRASQLDDDSSLDGTVNEPDNPDVAVYFCDGDLHVSKNRIFIPNGFFVVYVTGVLHIHNSVMAQNGWAVFLAEKGIQIENDAPNTLVLQGTYATNGTINSVAQQRIGNLTVDGSLLAGQGINLASGWDGRRLYTYHESPPILLLPHLIERMKYEIEQGRYK